MKEKSQIEKKAEEKQITLLSTACLLYTSYGAVSYRGF